MFSPRQEKGQKETRKAEQRTEGRGALSCLLPARTVPWKVPETAEAWLVTSWCPLETTAAAHQLTLAFPPRRGRAIRGGSARERRGVRRHIRCGKRLCRSKQLASPAEWAGPGKRAFWGASGAHLKSVASRPAAGERRGGGAERVGLGRFSECDVARGCGRASLEKAGA